MLPMGQRASDVADILASIEATCTDSEGRHWNRIDGEWSSIGEDEAGHVVFRTSEHHPLTLGHEAIAGQAVDE